jgi:hypothetical protein
MSNTYKSLNQVVFIELTYPTIIGTLPDGREVKERVYAVDEQLKYAICETNVYKLKSLDKTWAMRCYMPEVAFFKLDEWYDFQRFLSTATEVALPRA